MRRNRATEEAVARRQGAMLQLSPEEILRLIDERQGDYYRSELASPQLESAYDNYGHSAGQGNAELIEDMRRHYGVNKGLDPSTLPPEIQEQLVSAVNELKPQPVIAVKPKPENIAVVPVPGYEQSEPGVLRKAGDAIARADDAVQTAVRQKVYGERPDGSYGEGNVAGAKALIAHILHGSGKQLAEDPLERALYLAGTRGLQAGAITGAGAGLASLVSDNEAERGQIVIR